MSIKPLISRCLLQLYPARWRAEYGEELGGLLSSRPMTLFVFVDVVLSATHEHLRHAMIWKMCGICLFAWTVLGIVLNNTASLSDESYEWYKKLWWIIVLLAGCLTVVRRRDASPSSAAVKAAKAALLGFLPEIAALIFWTAGLFHPLVTRAAGPYPLLESRLAVFAMTFPTAPQPPFVFVPIEIGIIFIEACLSGFVGGLLGQLILFFLPRLDFS